MRRLALYATLLSLAACGTTSTNDYQLDFAKPNQLMGREIKNRVAQIPYQHRQELLDNMLWLAAKAGEQAIPTLLENLDNESPKVRSSCAWVLCKINDRRVIPFLQKKVNDPHESVRLEVARALVYLGDTKHVPTLITGLDSELLPVRYNCHMALKDSTKRDFGYDHLIESDRDRKEAVLSWWHWWGQQSGDPWFAENYAKQNNLPMPSQNQETRNPRQPGQMATPAAPGVETQGRQGQRQKQRPPQGNQPDTMILEQIPTESKQGTRTTKKKPKNDEDDPFKELPDFEEIELGNQKKQEKPSSRKSKK